MGDNRRVLGQSAPGATSSTQMYEVPRNVTATVTGVMVCNRNNAADTFRVSVGIAGEALATKQYLYYDTPISANDTVLLDVAQGFSLAPGDLVRVYAGTANLTFTLTGWETVI